ncbi:MAG: phenylalanine--tRNA ligase subunit beta, partial [Planctomycetota bacterium]|nr:phenylalanine--tRNA ligase subunit beta [Planctomycetota bacterium]
LSETPPAALKQRLTFHTAEVEDEEHIGSGLEGILTGRVTAVRPHPDADKLRLCTVEAGGEPIEVVCGAPNVAAGQVIAYAPEGTTLPGAEGEAPITLEAREIRGVLSRGMICSEREMGLGENHDGILVLPEDTAVGVPLIEAAPITDTVFDIDHVCITHRPDLWGHVGWAREVGALVGKTPTYPTLADPESLPQEGEPFPIAIDDAQGCRRYVGIVIENLQNGPSPLWLQRRLEGLGVRSIDLLVDLTNLVLLEQGQPLHAFDLRHVRGGEIRVRAARLGETMTTLDGQERKLEPGDLVIADGEGPVALAGVMGGADSEVRGDTTSILLEAATFDPVRIRRTATRLGLRSEASSRFEKNLDPELAMQAALRFTQLCLELCPGSRVTRPVGDCHPRPHVPFDIDLPYGIVRRRLGLRIGDFRIRGILTSLGFRAVERGECIRVTVPSWRATKDIERAEDLVEEVGRIAGYHRLSPVAPIAPMVPKRARPVRVLERRAASVLSLERGYAEVKHRSFYGAEDAERMGLGESDHLRVRNPSSKDHDRLILTTAAGLLRMAVGNQHREPAGRLWTSSRLFVPRAEGLPEEHAVLAMLSWDCQDDDAQPGGQFLALLADLEAMLDRMGIFGLEKGNGAHALISGLPDPVWLHPGRRAVLTHGDDTLAVVGEVLPAVVRAWGLEGRAVAAEIAMAPLVELLDQGGSRYEPVLRYPVVPFDVAVVVPRTTPAGDVQAVMAAAVEGHVRDVRVFDVYEGEGIEEGHRSLALRCELFDSERTLTPKASDALRAAITDAFATRGWSVRGG